MKTTTEKLLLGLAFICASMLFSGCRSGLTTSLVWRINDYHPATPSNLRLSTLPGTDDVLVQYDEQFASSSWMRHRAYWLLAYADLDTNAGNRPRPEFVDATLLTNLCPVLLIGADLSPPTNGFGAMPFDGEQTIRVWRNGKTLSDFNLPVYPSAPPVTWGRMALTPVTVATGVAIVSAVVSALGLAYGGAGGMGP